MVTTVILKLEEMPPTRVAPPPVPWLLSVPPPEDRYERFEPLPYRIFSEGEPIGYEGGSTRCSSEFQTCPRALMVCAPKAKLLVRHLRFVRDHHRKVRRVALAVDGKLAELAQKLADHFVDAELKQFPYDQLDEAVAWASGD